jgi:serine phosphatase RsbU (regulator of sigma subunit)
MMANLQAIARAHLSEGIGPTPSSAHFVETLNQQLAGRFGDNRYATLFWAVYNAQTAVLTYVNAGHPSPILIRSTGDIERLNSVAIPIGMFSSTRYTATKLQIRHGDRLVIFTDGVTDAQNAAGEEFGDERLVDCCRSIAGGIDASGLADRVMQAITDWSVGTEQFDDTTVVVINVDNSPPALLAYSTEAYSTNHWEPLLTTASPTHMRHPYQLPPSPGTCTSVPGGRCERHDRS